MKKYALFLILFTSFGFAQATPEEIADEELETELADAEAEQDENLMYDGIDTNEEEISDTGMLGASEGTYPDSEEIYVIDGDTPISNEVDVSPSWCN